MAKLIIITAKRNGYRRCGIAHPDTAVEYPATKFSVEQLKILKADSMLVVQEVDDAKPAAGGKGDK